MNKRIEKQTVAISIRSPFMMNSGA